MTRDELLASLADFNGEAQFVCIETLADERASLHPSNHAAQRSNLLTIYRRRAAHVKFKDLPTLGFEDAVRRLEDTHYERLRLVAYEAPTGHPWCVLFVAADSSEIVPVFAVTGSMPPT